MSAGVDTLKGDRSLGLEVLGAGAGTLKGDKALQAEFKGNVNRDRQERNRSYLAIAALGLGLVAACGAVAVLAKIHTVIPVVAVLNADGKVVKQEVVSKETFVAQEAFIQSAIHGFIQACNTFDPQWRQHYAEVCRVHATEAVAKQYDREVSVEGSENPYFEVGEKGRGYPVITAISPLGDKSYQVEFKAITERPGQEPTAKYFKALVRYAITLKPLAVGVRWENPLGIVVTSYRKDQELSR